MDTNNLYHHGILGQKWGVRRFQNKDGSLTSAGKKRYNNDKSEDQDNVKSHKRGLSDKQKTAIKVGAAVAVTALAAYGTYRLAKSGKLDVLINKGKSSVSDTLNKAGQLKIGEPSLANGLKKLQFKESISDSLKKANPLRNSPEGNNNCVYCSVAGFLRHLGYDVTARGTPGRQPQNAGGIIENCFKGVKVLDGYATKFGKSPEDAKQMLKKRFGNNAFGACAIKLKDSDRGHCFSWEIKDDIVSFLDFQQGTIGREFEEKMWDLIDPDGSLTLARLDGLEPNWDEIKKIVK